MNGDDRAGNIEKLFSLKEKGIISEGEFETKKRELLGLPPSKPEPKFEPRPPELKRAAPLPRNASQSQPATRTEDDRIQRSSKRMRLIFGALGGLVILGLVIAVVALVFFSKDRETHTRTKSPEEQTTETMRNIGTAIESYIVDEAAPPNACDIQSLSGILTPFYIEAFSPADGWGTEFRYRTGGSSSTNHSYFLLSAGPNRAFGDSDDRAFKDGGFVDPSQI